MAAKSTKVVTPWLKNVLKSTGGIAFNQIREIAPTMTAATVDPTQKLIQSIKSGKGRQNALSSAMKSNKYISALNTTVSSALKQLKTGELNTAVSSGDGEDDVEVSEAAKLNSMLAENSNRNTSLEIETIAASSQAIISSNQQMMSNSNSNMSAVLSHLSNIENSLAAMIQFNNENTANYYRASIAYYEKTGKAITESKKMGTGDVYGTDSYGHAQMDTAAYKKYIKQQFETTGLGGIMASLGDNVLQQMITNPLGTGMTIAASTLIPKVLGKTLGTLETSFNALSFNLLSKIGEWADNPGKDGLRGKLRSYIGHVFGLHENKEDAESLKRTKISRDAMQFDGETKHAIVEEITRELREQTQYLRILAQNVKPDADKFVDDNARIWSHLLGKFSNKSEIDKSISNALTAGRSDAMTSTAFGSGMMQLVGSQGSDTDTPEERKKKQHEMKLVVDDLFRQITKSEKPISYKDLQGIISQVGYNKQTKDILHNWVSKMQKNNANFNEDLEFARIRGNQGFNAAANDIKKDPTKYGVQNSSYEGADKNFKDIEMDHFDRSSVGASNYGGEYSVEFDNNLASKIRGVKSVVESKISDKNKAMLRSFRGDISEKVNPVIDSAKETFNSIKDKVTVKAKSVGDQIQHAIFGDEDPSVSAKQAKGFFKNFGDKLQFNLMKGLFGKEYDPEKGEWVKKDDDKGLGTFGGLLYSFRKSTGEMIGNFKTFLFGDKEKGEKSIFASIADSFNKGRGKNAKDDEGDGVKAAVGIGAGAITGALISKIGLFGAALGPAGPIGGAVAGLGIAIASQGKSFKEFLFGKEGSIEGESGKKYKDAGLLGKVGNTIKVNVVDPLADKARDIMEESASFVKEHFLGPVQLLGETLAEKVGEMFQPAKDFITNTIKKGSEGIKTFFAPVVEKVGEVVSTVADKVWGVTKKILATPGALIITVVKALKLGERLKNSFIGKGLTAIKEAAFNTIKNVGKGILALAKAPFKLAFNIAKGIGKTIGGAFKRLKESRLGKWFGKKTENAKEKLGNAFKAVRETRDKMLYGEDFVSKLNRFKETPEEKAAREARKAERDKTRAANKEIAKATGYNFKEANDAALDALRKKNPDQYAKFLDKYGTETEEIGADGKVVKKKRFLTEEGKAKIEKSRIAFVDENNVDGLATKAITDTEEKTAVAAMKTVSELKKTNESIATLSETFADDTDKTHFGGWLAETLRDIFGKKKKEDETDKDSKKGSKKNKKSGKSHNKTKNSKKNKNKKSENSKDEDAKISNSENTENLEDKTDAVEEANKATASFQDKLLEKVGGIGQGFKNFGGWLKKKWKLAAIVGLGAYALIKKFCPELLNMLGRFGEFFGAGAKEATKDAKWTNENNARTNGNTAFEEAAYRTKNIGKLTAQNGDATSTTSTKTMVAGHLAAGVGRGVVNGLRGAGTAATVKGLKGKTTIGTIAKVTTKASETLGELIGKSIKGLGKILSKKAGKEVSTEAAEKAAKAAAKKLSEKEAAKAAAKCSSRAAAGAAGAGLSFGITELIGAGIGALDGATGAAKLFQIAPENVNAKMVLISSAFGAFEGTTFGGIFAIIADIIGSAVGINLMHVVAVALYKAISDDDDDAALDKAQDEWKEAYTKSRDERLKPQYEAQIKAGIIPDNITYDEWIAGVMAGTYEADYKSFDDWNANENKSAIDHIVSGVAKVGGGAFKALGGALFGKTEKVYTDKNGNTYTENSDGTWKVTSADGEDLGSVAKKAIPKDATVEKKRTSAGLLTNNHITAAVSAVFAKKGTAWQNQSGAYYIQEEDGTWTYYSSLGFELEKGIPDEDIRPMIESGELTETQKKKGNVFQRIGDNTSALNKLWKETTEKRLKWVKDKTAALKTGFTEAFLNHEETVYVSLNGSYYRKDSNGRTYTKYSATDEVLEQNVPGSIVDPMIESGELTPTTKKVKGAVISGLGKLMDSAAEVGKKIKDKVSTTISNIKDRFKNWKDDQAQQIKEKGIFGYIKSKFTAKKGTAYGPDEKGRYFVANGDGYDIYNSLGLKTGTADEPDKIKDLIERGLLSENKDFVINSDVAQAVSKTTITGNVVKAATTIKDRITSWFKKKTSDSKTGDSRAAAKNSGSGFGLLNGLTYFSQTDSKWGNRKYGYSGNGDTMSKTGCGPTAMAMIASSLSGENITPIDMANLAQATGTRGPLGTTWDFINKASSAMGISSNQIFNPTAKDIADGLAKGPMILAGNGSAPFTESGHFVVATGFDENGNVLINDPLGKGRSKAYDINTVAQGAGSGWNFGGTITDGLNNIKNRYNEARNKNVSMVRNNISRVTDTATSLAKQGMNIVKNATESVTSKTYYGMMSTMVQVLEEIAANTGTASNKLDALKNLENLKNGSNVVLANGSGSSNSLPSYNKSERAARAIALGSY